MHLARPHPFLCLASAAMMYGKADSLGTRRGRFKGTRCFLVPAAVQKAPTNDRQGTGRSITSDFLEAEATASLAIILSFLPLASGLGTHHCL